MKVLVTGGTGFLGQRVSGALLERGDSVRVLGRNREVCARLAAEGAEIAQADLRDRPAIMEACTGMDAVLHAGALSTPWGKRSDFHAINVDGTTNVIAGCMAHRVSRLLYISSPSVVFDGRDGVNMTEDAPYPARFASIYSETKQMGEVLVARAFQGGLPTVVLRPKAIFGPGDASLLPRLLNAAGRGRLPQIGDGKNRVDVTYVDNVVHAIILALHSERAVGQTYTITNGESVLLWELIKEILERLGYHANLRAIPFRVAYGAAALMEARSTLTRREPLLTRYTVSILARTQTYDITAARRNLGYCPLISIADGVERTLAGMRSGVPEGNTLFRDGTGVARR